MYIYLPTGPYIFPIRPYGRATDWNLSAWKCLWPLYTTLWCWPGREIGLTVPSIKPKQFLRGNFFYGWHLHILVEVVDPRRQNSIAKFCDRDCQRCNPSMCWQSFIALALAVQNDKSYLNICMDMKSVLAACISLQCHYTSFFVEIG